MFMIEIKNLKKSFGIRTVLEIDELNLYSGEKIALTGVNGAGKSLLLNMIAGAIKPDEGIIKLNEEFSYIRQFSEHGYENKNSAESIYAADFNAKYHNGTDEFETIKFDGSPCKSGGEITRLKIFEAISKKAQILLADEPTANLDIEGITLLEKRLKSYEGLLILVSHDRELIDSVCSKTIEIENGKINIYKGNYSYYKQCKNMEIERKNFEYEEYVSEKKRLTHAACEKKQKSRKMKKAPSRMGNSEARLHTRGVNSKKAKIDSAAKSIESRIEKLAVKEKAYIPPQAKIDIKECFKLHSKIAVYGFGISKQFPEKPLFSDSDFEIQNGCKTAIIGPNGSGKTTLIKMILNGENGICLASSARVGYFSQSLEILDPDLTIIENIMNTSEYHENFVRLLLARLLFKRDDIYKKVSVLSGGERVKTAFAKIFARSNNILIFDEPTNYLDMQSQEALEEVLKEYEGTLIFASHDRKFISNIADSLIIIDEFQLKFFNGTYADYADKLKCRADSQKTNY